MAVISGTNLSNGAANGYVEADGFLGAPSAADTAAQRLSTTVASFPNGLTTTKIINTGQSTHQLVTVKATGNSVANARTVGTASSFIVVTATASTEGVKLPTLVTGLQVTIFAPTAVGVLVYASGVGTGIGTGTTNTTGFAVTKNTSTTFTAISSTKWLVSAP